MPAVELPFAAVSHNPVVVGLSVLAIAAQVVLGILVLLALLALVLPTARELLVDVRDGWLRGKELWLAWIVAAVATLGSLYFSEILHFIPCRMCWFQRIAMYPLAVVLLVGALRRDARSAVQFAFAFPIAGAIASIYHIYIENNPGAESASCKVGVPCSVKWIDQFGYITIPTLCLTAFALIGALLAFAWSRREPAGPAA
ncbi:MAG: disulfide bond formation protein B [Solirubrobacteraceae bacterium]